MKRGRESGEEGKEASSQIYSPRSAVSIGGKCRSADLLAGLKGPGIKRGEMGRELREDKRKGDSERGVKRENSTLVLRERRP